MPDARAAVNVISKAARNPFLKLAFFHSPSDVGKSDGGIAGRKIRTSSACLFVCFRGRFSQSTSAAPRDLQKR